MTPEGLKTSMISARAGGVVRRLRAFREHGVHVLAVHLRAPSDRPATFDACLSVAERSDLTFAQFVMLTPFQARSTSRRGRVDGSDPADRRHSGDAALADSAGIGEGLCRAPGQAPMRFAAMQLVWDRSIRRSIWTGRLRCGRSRRGWPFS